MSWWFLCGDTYLRLQSVKAFPVVLKREQRGRSCRVPVELSRMLLAEQRHALRVFGATAPAGMFVTRGGRCALAGHPIRGPATMARLRVPTYRLPISLIYAALLLDSCREGRG